MMVVRRYRFLLSLVAILPFCSLPAALRAQEKKPGEENARLRIQYFEEQRAYPFAKIPARALQRARDELEARWPQAFMPLGAGATSLTHLRWNPLGPDAITGSASFPASGRTSAIALDPRNPDVIYIGAAQGGIWKTTNGGASWTALTDKECSLAMGGLALDPVNPDIIYAGTGEQHFSQDSYYGCGVLRSTNGGATWQQLGAAEFDVVIGQIGGARISRVVIDPATAGSTTTTTVYAASTFGLYKSTNSGQNSTRILGGQCAAPGCVVSDLVLDPTNSNVLYAALGNAFANSENGVYKSTNGGGAWTRLTNGFPSAQVGRINLSIARGATTALYASIQDDFSGGGSDGSLLGIYKSTDAGSSWVRLNATGASCTPQCWYDMFIAAQPGNPDIVYFGGVDLYKSVNGGNSFTSIRGGIHVDQHYFAFAPGDVNTVYVANDGGVYRSTNAGASWTTLNTNLATVQFYSGVSLHPTDTTIVLGGTQDNGTLQFGGAGTWPAVLGGDGGFTAFDFLTPSTAYAETQWTAGSSFGGPRRRDNNGAFIRKVSGIEVGDGALFIPPLVMSATNPSVLYFGTFRLYRTTNRAESWTPISPDLTRGISSSRGVSAIAPVASDASVVYVGTNDGNVHVTTNGGASWTLITAGLPDRYVTDITVSPTDPRSAYLTVSGFGSGHIFRTTDGGASWQNASGNVPDVPVNAIFVDWQGSGDLYIGTDLGMFRSDDGGASWNPENEGFPLMAVFDLAFDARTSTLTAATHGRGMFRAALPEALVASVEVDADSVLFTAIGQTQQLTARAFDRFGNAVTGVSFNWSSLDTTIVAVGSAGLAAARRNGSTRVIARSGNQADTVPVRVQQQTATIALVAPGEALVVGERRRVAASARDANGYEIPNAMLGWTSSNPGVATVDNTGLVTGVSVGSAVLTASTEGRSGTAPVQVAAPSTLIVAAQAAAAPPRVSSSRGARLPLLSLELRVDGPEAIDLLALGFDVTGDDPAAKLLLGHDTNGDGTLSASELVVGSADVALRTGETARVIVAPSLRLEPQTPTRLIVALELSGGAPNAANFAATFLPQETRSVGARSTLADRLTLPPGAVASEAVETTLLRPGEVFTLSENPVRSARVIFNFSERPTVAGVYTLTGRRVADLLARMSSDGRVEWDLRNDDGAAVAPGVYLIVFDVAGRIVRERLMIVRPASGAVDDVLDEPDAGHEYHSLH